MKTTTTTKKIQKEFLKNFKLKRKAKIYKIFLDFKLKKKTKKKNTKKKK